MSKRRRAREIALKVLYQVDLIGTDPHESFEQVYLDEIAWPTLESFAFEFLKKKQVTLQDCDLHLILEKAISREILTEKDLADFAVIAENNKIQKNLLIGFFEKLQAKIKSLNSIKNFALELVNRTIENITKIDQILRDFADNWSLDRMAAVDRAILRFSICELLFFRDIPINVTINEAVEIAKEYSTEKSREFVNGILDRVQRKFNPEKNDPRKSTVCVQNGA